MGSFADDPGAILDGFSDAVVVVDDRLIITSANIAAANLIGAPSAEDLIGHSGIEWVHEPDRIDAVERLAALAARRQSSPVSLRLARLDGKMVWVEITGAVVTTSSGKAGIVLGLRNVDWRHAADLDAARVVRRSHVLVSTALDLQTAVAADLPDVLDAVTGGIGSVVNATVVSVHEVAPDRANLVLRSRWTDPTHLDAATKGAPASVPLSQIPNFVNALNSGRSSIELGADRHGISAELARVDPVLADGYTFAFQPGERLLGALTVGFTSAAHLSSDEHDFLERSASSIGVALHRIRIQQALLESEAMFRDLFEGSSAIMYLIDPTNLRLVDANEAAARFYGYPRETMAGMNLHEITFHSRADLAQIVDDVRAEGTTVIDERQRLSGGEERLVEIHSTPMRLGSRVLDLAIVQDVTEARRAVAHLQRLASTDDLTGAYNRRRFVQLVEDEIDRGERYDHPFSLLMLDLDHFKGVNDEHGHLAGDALLQEFTAQAKSLLRGTDRFGRMGGEEFGILLPETDLAEAETMAERVRIATEKLTIDEIDTPPCTVSIGGAQWQKGENADALFARADRMLYRAKRAGRNRFEA